MVPVKRSSLLVAPLLASQLASGCVEPGVCAGTDLLQVQTVDEESDEMRRFRAECSPISLRIFDASDRAIPFSDAQWMAKVHHIDLSGRGGRRFRHTVLDGKNVGHLMGE